MRALTLEDPKLESHDLDDVEQKKRGNDEETKRIERLDLDVVLPEFLS